jgi:3',5'-cyclic AMP phosphodiesterase CpdA
MRSNSTLIHISDLHFSNSTLSLGALIRRFGPISKRVLGRLNHRWRRRGHFRADVRDALLRQLQDSDWDILVISGDLITLGLESELAAARRAIEPLIEKGRVIIAPGNHDRYAGDVVNPDRLAETFADCFPFDSTGWRHGKLPYLEIGDHTLLMTLETACPRGLFSSRGRLDGSLDQDRAALLAQYPEHRRVIIGHYPVFLPEGELEGPLHALAGKKRLQRFLVDHRVDFYLHGHIHKSWHCRPVDRAAPLCLNSGGCCRYASGPWSGYHRLILSKTSYRVERVYLEGSSAIII